MHKSLKIAVFVLVSATVTRFSLTAWPANAAFSNLVKSGNTVTGTFNLTTAETNAYCTGQFWGYGGTVQDQYGDVVMSLPGSAYIGPGGNGQGVPVSFTPTGAAPFTLTTPTISCTGGDWTDFPLTVDPAELNALFAPVPPPTAITATTALNQIVSSAATQTSGVTIYTIQNYWPYILVISIIAGLLAAFHKRIKIWK